MSKGVFTDSIFYILVGLFPLVVNFFLLPVITRYLTPAEYGELTLVQVFISTFSIIVTMQIHSGVSKYFFEYSERKRKIYLSTLIFASLVIAFFVFAFLFFFGEMVVKLMFDTRIDFYPYFFLGILTILFSAPVGVTTAFFKVERMAANLFFIVLVSSLFGAGFTVFQLVNGRDMQAVLLGGLLTAGLSFVLQLFVLRNQFIPSFDITMLLKNIKFGMPVIPHAVGGYLFMYSDKLILDKFVVLTLLGIYAIGDKFSTLFKTFVNSYANAINPVLMGKLSESSDKGSELYMKLSTPWFIILGVAYYVFINYIEYVIYFMLPSEYHPAATLIPILSLAYVIRGIYIFPAFTFYYLAKTKYLPIATLSSGVLNVVLNIILIPLIGIWGAALTTLLSFAFNWWVLEYFSKKLIDLKYDIGALKIAISLIAISILVFYGLSGYDHSLKFLMQSVILLLILVFLFKYTPIAENVLTVVKRVE